jgi:TIR domain/AAA ATPase domain
MSSTRSNPFVYGGPVDVEHFVGREGEISRLFQQVTSTARGSVAITGERRIGKTSLLHYVSAPDVIRRWVVGQKSAIVLFIDCGAIAPLSITRFWQYVLPRLRRQLASLRPDSRVLTAIDTLLGAPDVRTSDIEFLIEDIHAEKLIFVLMLDEFEWVVRTDPGSEGVTRELLGGLRALINHSSHALSLIVATRRPLHEVCEDVRFMGSPFYNNFIYLHLRPFSRQEADSLLEQMLKETAVVFSLEDRALIDELAGTHPVLLQAAASCVFDLRGATPHADIDRRLVLDRFMDLTDHHWQDLWRGSSAEEQYALMRMGRDPQDASVLERRPNERRRLLKRGLIIEEGDGVRFFSPMLRHWLRERVAEQERSRAVSGDGIRPMVFVSYSHKDETEKEALMTQLRVLQSGADLVEVWNDDTIAGGDVWQAAIEKALERARVAVLLITANFLISDFILNTEVPKLLWRREQEGIEIIPVIARPCPWKRVGWLQAMNVRPQNGRPIWGSDKIPPDEALAAIAEEIAALVTR